jgi:hypothetical protein
VTTALGRDEHIAVGGGVVHQRTEAHVFKNDAWEDPIRPLSTQCFKQLLYLELGCRAQYNESQEVGYW